MEPEITKASEINQSQKEKYHAFSHKQILYFHFKYAYKCEKLLK